MSKFYIDFSSGSDEFHEILDEIQKDVSSYRGFSFSVVEIQEDGIVLVTGDSTAGDKVVYESALKLFQSSQKKEGRDSIESESCFCLLEILAETDIKVRQILESRSFFLAEEGSVEEIKCLQNLGISLSKKDAAGLTPLMYAAFSNREDLVRQLLKKGVDINATSVEEKSALSYAAQSGSFGCIQPLLEAGSTLSNSDLMDLISHDFDIHKRFPSGRTLLMYAACWGSSQDVFITLIENGVDVDAVDDKGLTAIAYTALYGYEDAFFTLIDIGADLMCLDYLDRSIIIQAIHGGNQNILDYLLDLLEDRELPFLPGLIHVDAKGISPLSYSALYGNEECFEKLLHLGSSLTLVDDEGRSLKSHAVIGGSIKIFKQVVDALERERVMDLEEPLLSLALKNNHDEMFSYLVEQGEKITKEHLEIFNELEKDIDYPGFNGKTFFILVLEQEDESLFELFFNLLVTESSNVFFSMKYLFDSGKIELVDDLLFRGYIDVNQEYNGLTLIDDQVNQENLEAVQLLLRHKAEFSPKVIEFLYNKDADLSKENYFGETLLKRAIEASDSESIDCLISFGASISEFEFEALLQSEPNTFDVIVFLKRIIEEKKDEDYLDQLIRSHHFNVEACIYLESHDRLDLNKLYFGETLLTSVLKRQDYEFLDYIASRDDLDLEIPNNLGEYPLQIAVKNSLYATELLVEKGAKTDIRDFFQRTLLMLAIHEDQEEIVFYLEEKKIADVHAYDQYWNRAIYYAARLENIEILSALIRMGADVNAHNIRGQTALMEAARYGSLETIKELVAKGAKVNLVDIDGGFALSYALIGESGFVEEIISFLMKKKADPFNPKGLDIISFAAYYQKVERLFSCLFQSYPNLIPLWSDLKSFRKQGFKELLAGNISFYLDQGINPLKVAYDLGFADLFKNLFEDLKRFYSDSHGEIYNILIDFSESTDHKIKTNFIFEDIFHEEIGFFLEIDSNPLEFCYTLGSRELFKIYLLQLVELKGIEQAKRLSLEFLSFQPDFGPDYFYEVDPSHFDVSVTAPLPESKPEGMSIHYALELFDRLDFSKVKREFPEEEFSLASLRAGVERFIHRIEIKEPFLGTPKEGSIELEDYYKDLENTLCHILVKFTAEDFDSDIATSFLADLACSAYYCGGRYMAEVSQWYQILYKDRGQGRFSPFQGMLFKALQGFRQGIIEDLCREYEVPSSQEVHVYNFYVHALSEVRLVGGELLERFDDHLADPLLTEERVRREFYQAYSPERIIRFISDYFSSADTSGYIRQAFREVMPESFRQEEYTSLAKEVIESAHLGRKEVNKLFQKDGLYFKSEDLSEDVIYYKIEELRFYTYLENIVYDEEYRLREKALIYLLEQQGILRQLYGRDGAIIGGFNPIS